MIQSGTVEKGPRGLRRSRVVAREKAVLRCLNVIGGQGAGALLLLLATRRRRRTVYLAWSHTVITFLAMSVVALAAWWATTALSGV